MSASITVSVAAAFQAAAQLAARTRDVVAEAVPEEVILGKYVPEVCTKLDQIFGRQLKVTATEADVAKAQARAAARGQDPAAVTAGSVAREALDAVRFQTFACRKALEEANAEAYVVFNARREVFRRDAAQRRAEQVLRF